MEKMPVGATIAHAYGFLIRRFFRILGLIWLPVAIYGAGAIAISPAFFARAARIAEFGPSLALWRDEVEILLFLVLGLFLFSVPAISLSRLALGLEKNRYLAHFNFGIREWRFFLASLRLMLILAAIVIAVGIIAYAMAWALASFEIVPIPLDARGLPSLAAIRESPTLNLGIIAAELIALAAMVYASIRFGFLLASLAAAEEHASLKRAGALSAGQFWKMLAVSLLVAVPVWLAGIAGSYFALAADFGRFYGFAVAPDERAQHLAAMAGIVAAHAAPLMALKAAGLFLFSALFFGAGAAAYRSLSQPETHQPQANENPPPVVAPRMLPIAAAGPIAAAEPAIERSLLEQFGDRVYEDAPEAATNGHKPPPAETHSALRSEPSQSDEAHAAPDAGPPDGDILELEEIHEIKRVAEAKTVAAPMSSWRHREPESTL